MKELSYLEAIEFTTSSLAAGKAFLNVGGETPNTMTIGWGMIGYMWNRPVFMAVVRPQRHTHDMLIESGEFTVSIPTKNDLKQQLIFAGRESGRDYDKFSGHSLTAQAAQAVSAPIIAECGLHIECKTRLVQEMTGDRMDDEVIRRAYPEHDFHTMFIGEIVSVYTTDE